MHTFITEFIWGGSKITADGGCSHEIKRLLLLGRQAMNKLDSTLKSRDIYFANKGPSSPSFGFSNSHVWMWESDYKESWELKNWCFWTVVLEKTLGSPWDCKEIQPVHPKGNHSWIFTGRTDAEAETSILWPLEAKIDWKRFWCWEKLKTGEGDDKWWGGQMASLTRWTWDGASSRVGDGQGSLVCCSPWGHRVGHDWATELNW